MAVLLRAIKGVVSSDRTLEFDFKYFFSARGCLCHQWTSGKSRSGSPVGRPGSRPNRPTRFRPGFADLGEQYNVNRCHPLSRSGVVLYTRHRPLRAWVEDTRLAPKQSASPAARVALLRGQRGASRGVAQLHAHEQKTIRFHPSYRGATQTPAGDAHKRPDLVHQRGRGRRASTRKHGL